jgi:hypothetical protein
MPGATSLLVPEETRDFQTEEAAQRQIHNAGCHFRFSG